MFAGALIIAVAICSLVLLAVIVIAYARRRNFLQKGGLGEVVGRYYLRGRIATDRQRDLFLTLVCYEDRYPSFGAILEKIAPKFPLTYFAKRPEFGHALENLMDLADQGMGTAAGQIGERAALSTVVRIVIEDPRVVATYGKELEPLVDDFIQQLGIGVENRK